MTIPIRGTARGTPDQAYARAIQRGAQRPAFLDAYLTALYADAATQGIDGDSLVAQWDLETDSGRSAYWLRDGNPAGIGAFTDGSDLGLKFTPETAARIHVTHMCSYLGISPPASWIAADPRWQAVVDNGWFGSVRTTADLGSGKWADDADYPQKLRGRYVAYWGEPEPTKDESMVTSIAGYVPKQLDKWLHITQDGYAGVTRYIPNRNGNKPRIIVLHIQEGSNWGSWQHFHVVKASCTVMIAKNGDIWRLVEERHGPWTNGDVKSPDAHMTSIMNRWGWDPNVYSLTIEHEGYSGGLPYTLNQLKSSIWQVAKWCRDYAIDAVYIVRHGQINSQSRSHCPERPPYTFTEAVRSAVKGTPVIEHEIYRDPWPVLTDSGARWDGLKDVTVTTGPTPVTFFADKRMATVNVPFLNGRQWAATASNLTPTGKTQGDKIAVLGWVEGEDVGGERRWWVAVDGTRYWAGGTLEKPVKAAPIPETPTDPDPKPDYGNLLDKVPKVLNGSVYYPFEDRDGDAGRGRLLRVNADGNLREWAGTTSASKGTVKAGDDVWCSYWVRGEKVNDEDLWYVIDTGTDPIHTGPRIWAGLVEERPD